jgi:integrase/recombinase XerD
MRRNHSEQVRRLIYEMELRNYSANSIRTYSELLTQIEESLQIPLDKITTEQFKNHLHHRIKEDEVSVALVNQSISAWKILQVDVLKQQWETVKIKRPRRVIKLPVVLSVEEVERLIAATTNIKHRSLLMLAYSAGLRRQETQMIKPSAIDSARMVVHVVQGKGKKDRYTILSPKALETLRTYYRLARPRVYLFEPNGRQGCIMSDQTLNTIVKDNAVKAGITKKISFHTLRHSFATHLLEKGVNLRLIQQFMGHASLKTTAGYLHLVNVDMTKVISPLDLMHL